MTIETATAMPRSGKEISMSKEDAAVVFIDRLLGFGGAYSSFMKAADTLTDEEKELLAGATASTIRDCSTE